MGLKRKICIYHYQYLPISETFIYRQLLGLNAYFDFNILTRKIENLEEFPYFSPILVPKEKKYLGVRFNSEKKFFQNQLKDRSLLHVNFGHVALPMQQHAISAGIPMTAYFHGVDASAFLNDPNYVNALKDAKFAAVVVCSKNMKKRLTPYLPDNMSCFVSYYGVPLDRYPFKQRFNVPVGATFMQLCRFGPKKGIDITVRAFSHYLKEIDSQSRLVLAGDGPLMHEIKSLVALLGIEDKVSLPGAVTYEKALELFTSADVFLHPSVTDQDGDMEGIPNAIIEAMASGLPVVSTWHSGVPELIESGQNGFLAKERDVMDLFDKIVDLKSSDVGMITHNARLKVEQHFNQYDNQSKLASFLNGIID